MSASDTGLLKVCEAVTVHSLSDDWSSFSYSPNSRCGASIPKSRCSDASNIVDNGRAPCCGLWARIRIASGATPHSPKVRPSAAYMCRQSKGTPSCTLGFVMLMASAVTAAINSSVTSVVQLIRDEIRALMIRSFDESKILVPVPVVAVNVVSPNVPIVCDKSKLSPRTP